MATRHDPAHDTSGAAADTAAKATIWSIAQEAVGQVRDAIGRLMRGTSGEGRVQMDAEDSGKPELHNLDDKVQVALAAFLGGNTESARQKLEWIRYARRLLSRAVEEGRTARAAKAQRCLNAIRLVNPGQISDFADDVAEGYRDEGEEGATRAAFEAVNTFSPEDPEAGMAIIVLERAERFGEKVLDGIRGLPARLTPAMEALERTARWAWGTTRLILVIWLAWIAIFGVATLIVGVGVSRFDDWMFVMLLAVVGYILPTAVVPALLSEGVGLVLGAVYGIGAALQGTLRALGADLEPLRRDESHETLAQRVSDFRGKLILPAALGVATWFAMWCLLFPSGASSMVVALAAALLGAAAPWILKGEERDAWAKQALVVTTLLVAIGLLAAAVGAPLATDGGIGAYRGGLLAAPFQALAHGVWRVLGVAGGQAELVANQSFYGSMLVLVSGIVAVTMLVLLRKGKWAIGAVAIGLLLWMSGQGDREVAMAPVPSGVSAEERAMEATEVASMEREERLQALHQPSSQGGMTAREAQILFRAGQEAEKSRLASAQPVR